MPGFPGAAWSSLSRGDWASFHASACSRPPDPTRSTRIAIESTCRAGGPAAALFVYRDEVHRHLRAPAHAVGLVRPREVAEQALVLVAAHDDRIRAEGARLGQDALGRPAGADDSRGGLEAGLLDCLDGAPGSEATRVPFLL